MKSLKLSLYTFLIATLLLVTGCKHGYLDDNLAGFNIGRKVNVSEVLDDIKNDRHLVIDRVDYISAEVEKTKEKTIIHLSANIPEGKLDTDVYLTPDTSTTVGIRTQLYTADAGNFSENIANVYSDKYGRPHVLGTSHVWLDIHGNRKLTVGSNLNDTVAEVFLIDTSSRAEAVLSKYDPSPGEDDARRYVNDTLNKNI